MTAASPAAEMSFARRYSDDALRGFVTDRIGL